MQKKSRPLCGLLFFLRSVALCCVLFVYLCPTSCAAGLCHSAASGLCVCRAALLLRHGVSHSISDARGPTLSASRNDVDVCLHSATYCFSHIFACTLVLACGTSNWLCMIGLCLTYVGLVLKTAENLGALRAYTFSSHTRGTPVAVVLFLNGLKPNLSYNRKLRSLFVLVKSTRRFDSALPIMASSRAEP